MCYVLCHKINDTHFCCDVEWVSFLSISNFFIFLFYSAIQILFFVASLWNELENFNQHFSSTKFVVLELHILHMSDLMECKAPIGILWSNELNECYVLIISINVIGTASMLLHSILFITKIDQFTKLSRISSFLRFF